MLLYIIVTFCIAAFFLSHRKKLQDQRSDLLAEYCKTETSALAAAGLLRFLGFCALGSGLLMLLCLLLEKGTGVFPRWLAALSILLYGGGFILGMLKLKTIQKEEPTAEETEE